MIARQANLEQKKQLAKDIAGIAAEKEKTCQAPA